MTRPHRAPLSLRSGTTAVLLGLLLTSGTNAQTGIDAASNPLADAPETTTKRTLSVVPRFSVTETFTDNLYLSSSAMQSERVTELSPGIRVNLEGARLKAFIDYSLTGLSYAGDDSLKRSQNALNALGTLELVERWLFVDFGGTISQQAISAFGKQAGNNIAINGNQAEVADYRVSSYLRGRLASALDYEARITRTTTRPDAPAAPSRVSTDGTFKLAGGGTATGLGWSVDAGQQSESYTDARDTLARRFNLGLSKALSPQFNLSATMGSESNNYTTLDQQTTAAYSLGLNWTPSDVTKLAATAGQRSFGSAHDVSFEHRSGRTIWTFSDVTDIYIPKNSLNISSQGSNYDLLYRQFASVQPDPTARATLVNNYLQNNGISATTASSYFLASAVTLQRHQGLSFALLGLRDTILFSASRSRSTRLDTLSTGVDDLSNTDVVHQRGFSVNYAHRLTPGTSLGVIVSRQNNSGSSSLQDNSLQELHVSLTGKVGKQAAATLGARRVLFDSSTAPYAATSLNGNFTLRF